MQKTMPRWDFVFFFFLHQKCSAGGTLMLEVYTDHSKSIGMLSIIFKTSQNLTKIPLCDLVVWFGWITYQI